MSAKERRFCCQGFYCDNASFTAIYTAASKAIQEPLTYPDITPVEMARPGGEWAQ